jgi:hypothetical protein
LSGGDWTNPPIGEALANGAKQAFVGALGIVQLAGVVAEVELVLTATPIRQRSFPLRIAEPARSALHPSQGSVVRAGEASVR